MENLTKYTNRDSGIKRNISWIDLRMKERFWRAQRFISFVSGKKTYKNL